MKDVWFVGGWVVDLRAGWIRPRRRLWGTRRQYPDARLMAVLELLIRDAGRTVSVDHILRVAWSKRVVGRDSVSTAIYQLRQVLGDDAQRPHYIRTDARRGYRLIQPVVPARFAAHRSRLAAAVVAMGVLGTSWALLSPVRPPPPSLLVEALDDQSRGALVSPLPDAIGSTLLSELVARMPGQVMQAVSENRPAVALRSQLVVCDLGPALVVHLLDTRDERFLWSNAYSMREYGAASGPSLVQVAADDISAAFSSL